MNQLIQKAVSSVEKLRKTIEKTPFFKTPVQDGNDEAYNLALSDVQSLLPQIITGVIEEIEKIAKRMSEWAQLQYERAEHMEFLQAMNDLRRRKNPLNFFERIICVFLPEYPRE